MEPDSPALEQIWRDLRPHLEWAQGFALVFLFAGHPQPVELLRRRLEESLQLRSLRLNFIAPATPDETPRAVEQILAARPDPGRGPLWVELWRGSEEEDWPQARRQALRRLNERRFLLERDVALPIVVVLPREDRGRVYIEAPDLWAVRSYTAELPTPTDLPRATEVVRSDGYVPALGAPPGPIELEWARLLKTTKDRGRLNPWDGFAAFEAATDRGDLAAARAIASQTIDICRERVEASSETSPEARTERCATCRSRSTMSAGSSAISAIWRPPAPPIARAWNCAAICARRSATPRRPCATCRSRSTMSARPSAISAIWRPPAPPIARAWNCAAICARRSATPRRPCATCRSRSTMSARPSAISAIWRPPAPPIARAWSFAAVCARRSATPRRPCATCRSRSTMSAGSSAISAIWRPPAPPIARAWNLRRHLREALGDTPQALRDLSVSLEQCRPDRGRSRQSGGRPHRLSREPGAAPPAARGARRHAAGIARSVDLARQCRPGRARSRQSGGRPHRLSREPGACAAICARRSATRRRHCAICRSRSTMSARPSAISAIWRPPAPPIARAWSFAAGCARRSATRRRHCAICRSRSTMSARPSAISAIWRPPAPPIARAWSFAAGCARRSATPRRHCATCRSRSNNVGRTERDLGNLEAARTAYRESLELRRRLREALGDTPQALRDLSVSLNNVGRIERDLGNLEAARTAYRESLELAPPAARGTRRHPAGIARSVGLADNVGRIERDLGNLEAARTAYRESLDIAQRLSRTFPDNPQYRRDLAWIEARANAPIEQARP